MMRGLTEDEEFGMQACEGDPIEAAAPPPTPFVPVEAAASSSPSHAAPVPLFSAVHEHPDFTFLDREYVRAISTVKNDPQCPLWLAHLPIEADASKWTILQVQLRPDRAWDIIKELLGTVCVAHGLLLMHETPASLLFRKQARQSSVAHGVVDTVVYQNVLVHVGVLPSKLRALHVAYCVSFENKLAGGLMTSRLPGISASSRDNGTLEAEMDTLLGALQATILSQYLALSCLFMLTLEDQAVGGEDRDVLRLDHGYVDDVKKAFLREMKATMRELCIPLEEYAHNEEYACAMLLGLLDPLLKKYGLDMSEATAAEAAASLLPSASNEPNVETNAPPAPVENATNSSDGKTGTETATSGKLYGELVTDMVHELWTTLKTECEKKVDEKIDEKQQQVTRRVQSAHDLRRRAIQAIIEYDAADLTTLMPSTPGAPDDVLLYDGSCMVNGMLVKLNVTFGHLIYRTMVPLFARTTIVPFDAIEDIVQATTLGIRVIQVHASAEFKDFAIAMGMELELLYQLLVEVFSMHKVSRSQHLSQDLTLPDMHVLTIDPEGVANTPSMPNA